MPPTLSGPTLISDGLYRQIVESAHEGVWMVDSEGKTAYANPQMAQMLRCEPSELIGTPALNFVFPEDVPSALVEKERRASSEAGQRLEFRYRRADGTELWALVKSSIIPGPGEERFTLGLLTDMTAEKAAERERELLHSRLQSKQELLARLIDTIPVMMFIHDPVCAETEVNREFTRLLGWTQKDANTDDFIETCYPDPQERERARQFMDSLTPGWKDFQVATKAGGFVDSSWANIRLSDGRVVGVGIDSRERLAAEHDLKRSEARLRASEARLKLALDSMDLGSFDYDIPANTVKWSERTKEIFGLRPDAPVEFDTIWRAVPAEDIAQINAAVRGAVESGSGRYAVEHRAIGIEDGVERWVAAWGRVVLDSNGEVIGFTGLNLDITERKRIEQGLADTRHRQEILSEVLSRLLTSGNPQEIIEDLARRVMAKTGAGVFFNFLLDKRTGRLHLNASAGVSEETVRSCRSIAVGEFVCGKAAEGAKCITLEAIQESDDPTSCLVRSEKVRAYSCYPLLSAGTPGSREVLGTLSFGTRTKDRFSQPDLDLMQDVAGYIAIALDRMRDRRTLQESEERYRTIARNIPNGAVWVVDRDLRVTAGEGPLAARLGPAGAAIRGLTIKEAWREEIAPAAEACFLLALAGEESTVESRLSSCEIFTHFAPIRDERGEVVAAMALSLDITERKAAENALRESESRDRARVAELEAIMDAVPAATWVARDPECLQITANRFGYEILRAMPGTNVSKTARKETTAEEEKAIDFRVTRQGQDIEPEDLPIQKAARTGIPVRDSEMEIRFPDGSVRILFGNAVPLFDAAGKPSGAVGAFIDLTERRKVEEQLLQAQKLESIGVLAGGVAHDFNNLLTGVMGNASLAQLDAPPRIAQKLGLITEAAERAAGLTRQLLAYAGKAQFFITDVDLAQVIRSSSQLLEISISKNIVVRTGDVPPRLPVVRADPAQLQQVIVNLVMNAAEAIGNAHAGVITLSAGRAEDPQALDLAPGNYVYFKVTDTGCGIGPAELPKIFDPFFTTKFTGRGLGLAAVQGIVRSLGGTIRVKSQVGEGSEFSVYLACVYEAPPVDVAPRFLDRANPRKMTVLVVDDEPLVRDVAAVSLENFGHRVLAAGNGKQALDMLDRHPDVNLVLLDVIMPVMSGLDALEVIRERWPHVTVLLTSGFDRDETHRMGSRVDGVPFIQKPYTIQQLAAAVEAALP